MVNSLHHRRAVSMASSLLILSVILLSLSSLFSSSLPSSIILDAAEILSSSGFQTMALNLELASRTLQPLASSLTIFAPSEFAFREIDHLPLSLLQYHLLPHVFSLQSLSSLPFGAKITTLLPGHFLTVTKLQFNEWISINDVTINGSPIFNDGTLVIFGIEKLFDPYFQNPSGGSSNLGCIPMMGKNDRVWSAGAHAFEEACGIMRSKGCSVLASFLEMQVLGIKDRPDQFTLFAPVDEAMLDHLGNLSSYSSILRQHLVPCKISWGDLVSLDNGTVLSTYERGFTINVTEAGDDKLLLNGVPVILPDLYYNDWLVVHALQGVLSITKESEQGVQHSGKEAITESEESSFEFGHYNNAEHPTSQYHFSVFH